LQANFPTLAITLSAVNELGQDAGNALIVANRDLTLLQDGDQNQNQQSDVWDESWQVTWRDLVVLNGENEKAFVVNLTTFDLGNTANYQQLGRALVQLAIEDQRPWCNAANVLDVDENGVVEIDDFQLVVSHLNQQGPSTLSPSVVPTMKLDCDYDGYSAPLDALRILNYLNAPAAGGEGEAFVELPYESLADSEPIDATAWDRAFDEPSTMDWIGTLVSERSVMSAKSLGATDRWQLMVIDPVKAWPSILESASDHSGVSVGTILRLVSARPRLMATAAILTHQELSESLLIGTWPGTDRN
jgi:Dockerin type I domain